MTIIGKHVLSTEIFDDDRLAKLFELADFLEPVARGVKTAKVIDGAVLASLFFEPSTRTRLSFDSAFSRLGGSVSNVTDFSASSIIKGESLQDTCCVVSGYADAIVIRHPLNGAVSEFASVTNIPVINGGCGSEEHPTQALLDLYTLKKEAARLGLQINGLTIAFVGDLKYGRTIHSLLRLLSLSIGINYIFVSPEGLELPGYFIEMLSPKAKSITQCSSLGDISVSVDVLYSTRIQRERIPSAFNFESKSLRITKGLVDSIGVKCIMHPLPRDSRDLLFDLSDEFEFDDRLAIFRQTDNGIQIRMALFCQILDVESQARASLRDAKWWRPNRSRVNDAGFYLIKE